ncbi:MAG: PKD domain-containing protein [Planctomycetes bacterium]|nr:PKD domain-containing protein [Planctomycetota bacterium]
MVPRTLACCGVAILALTEAGAQEGYYFPPAGEGLSNQDQRSPAAIGLNPAVIEQLAGQSSRWALWRHGYLVHVEGDFNAVQEVKSLRKTWHALTVGAAIKQGKIPSYNQPISVWETNLTGKDADATWWHVITQSSGFDYPYDTYPDYDPGVMWTYSDKNPKRLCNALAKAYGTTGFEDDYADVIREAYFDAIGMRGWSTTVRNDDGIRFSFDLEDMGRLGLLVLARGRWNGVEVIPQWFVEELEQKQTYGMLVNYNGPDDGVLALSPADFPESPYGYMTWVNTDGDVFVGASTAWAYGAGAGGTFILWNRENGIVFAGVGIEFSIPLSSGSVPHVIEANIMGPNPLVLMSAPPVIQDATAMPNAGPAPLAVQFTASASDPEGDPLSYAWDFDGNGAYDATGATAGHTYEMAGPYTARLRVRDGANTVTRDLLVTVEAPSVSEPPPPAGGDKKKCGLLGMEALLVLALIGLRCYGVRTP